MTEILLPQPSEINGTEKERAMAAYLTMFATTTIGLPLPFLNFFAAIAYHLYIRKTSPFVSFHSYQSLISQFITSIFNGVTIVWAVISFIQNNFTDAFFAFLILTVIINLVYFILSVLAAVKAYQGKMFYFFFFGKIAFRHGYRTYENNENTNPNTPPAL
ncbi:MAG: DUF4870 domain-containing protein [Balneolaceae bacterium]